MAKDNSDHIGARETDTLEIIAVEPKHHQADATIVWLHGLGADGNDFIEIAEQLGLPNDHRVRFLFPHAPIRAITVNNHMHMRGWYDIFSFDDINGREDAAGINHSAKLLGITIQQELAAGIASSNILLAGFSQGAAMSLYTGLRYSKSLGGIIALSGYMPLIPDKLKLNHSDFKITQHHQNHGLHAANTQTPIFMAHGLYDQIVPFDFGKKSYHYLTSLTYNVQWQTYPMQHDLCLEEVNDIGIFVRRVLGY